MLKRFALVMGVVLLATATACSSNADEEYEKGLEDFALLEYQGAEGDHRALADFVENQLAAWSAPDPPAAIASEHDQVAEGLGEFARTLEDLEGGQAANAEFANAVEELTQDYADWRVAFRSHYKSTDIVNEGASMDPALGPGARLEVPYYDGEPIERWQIVVFTFHLDESRTFIKRVVGLPGEEVEVREGLILIDGSTVEGDMYALAAPNYAYGPDTVPAGHYFVLGDNRRNSYDSHAWASGCLAEQTCDFVPEENIIGVLPADTTAEGEPQEED